MTPRLFGDRPIGPGHPCLVVAEIGINHSGSVATAIDLIIAAKESGADAVKFQAGDPTKYVNRSAWDTPRETPWGTMPYIEYRQRMELSDDDFDVLTDYCRVLDIPWFVSPLDAGSVQRFERFHLPAYKVASPKLTDRALLEQLAATGRTIILSTGMSTLEHVNTALQIIPPERAVVLHAVSAYPCDDDKVNLPAIRTLQVVFGPTPIGYSGHERGIWPTLGAVAMGARVVERHFTLDRTSWGSDQAASLEPSGFAMMVRGIRSIEAAMSGDGVKRLRDYERANHTKFRSVA